MTCPNCTPRPSHKSDLYLTSHVRFSFTSLSALTPEGDCFTCGGKKNSFSALGKEGKGKMVVESKVIFALLLLFAPGFDAFGFGGSRRYGGSYR